MAAAFDPVSNTKGHVDLAYSRHHRNNGVCSTYIELPERRCRSLPDLNRGTVVPFWRVNLGNLVSGESSDVAYRAETSLSWSHCRLNLFMFPSTRGLPSESDADKDQFPHIILAASVPFRDETCSQETSRNLDLPSAVSSLLSVVIYHEILKCGLVC